MARQELDLEKPTALYPDLQTMLYKEGGNLTPFHINQIVVTSVRGTGSPANFDDCVQYNNESLGEQPSTFFRNKLQLRQGLSRQIFLSHRKPLFSCKTENLNETCKL